MAKQQAHPSQQAAWWSGPLAGLQQGAAGVQAGVAANLQGLQVKVQRWAQQLQQQQPRGLRPLAPASVSLAGAPPGLPPAHSVAAAGAPLRHQLARREAAGQQLTSREELGRATWTFLHTLAAQFPERPSRQQQRDARQLLDALTRIYPCAECARHWRELVRRDPPDVSSGPQFAAWMCRAHNAVNRRLGKPSFNCELVAARWAPLDCDEHNSCALSTGLSGVLPGRN